MCKAIAEIRAEGIEEGIEKGIERGIEKGGIRMLIRLVENGKIDILDAAMEASMSVDEFKRYMEKNDL